MNLYLLIICLTLKTSYGWDSDQLEVFDIVEEVKVNFYELLNVSQVRLYTIWLDTRLDIRNIIV